MVSILYILARMGSKMVQEKFKNLARIDPWGTNLVGPILVGTNLVRK